MGAVGVTTPATTEGFQPSKQVRCDAACPAQAFVLVKFISGELTFCAHHFQKYEASLIKDAYEVVDKRTSINTKSESSA